MLESSDTSTDLPLMQEEVAQNEAMAQSSLPALAARVSCSRGNTMLAALRLGSHRRDSTSGGRSLTVLRMHVQIVLQGAISVVTDRPTGASGAGRRSSRRPEGLVVGRRKRPRMMGRTEIALTRTTTRALREGGRREVAALILSLSILRGCPMTRRIVRNQQALVLGPRLAEVSAECVSMSSLDNHGLICRSVERRVAFRSPLKAANIVFCRASPRCPKA